MDPITLGVLVAANAGMAALKSSQAARQRKQEADMRAAEIEASPWTGKGPSTQVATAAPNVWGEMAGGAINALGQAAALENAGLFKSGDVAGATTGSSAMTPSVYSQTYGQANATVAEPWKMMAAQSSPKPLSKFSFFDK